QYLTLEVGLLPIAYGDSWNQEGITLGADLCSGGGYAVLEASIAHRLDAHIVPISEWVSKARDWLIDCRLAVPPALSNFSQDPAPVQIRKRRVRSCVCSDLDSV